MLLNLKQTFLNWYFEHIALSSATSIRNSLGKNWQKNPQMCDCLKNLYGSMRPISSEPDWAGVSSLLIKLRESSVKVNKVDRDIGVIVETRQDDNLEFVVQNFIEHTGLSVQIFHGSSNLEFILTSNLKRLIDSGQVLLVELPTEKLDARLYNALFLSSEFWEVLAGRKKIFVFQTDSCLCPKSDYQLRDFINFDYIGSRWTRKRPIGLVIDGGSGGLSIRDWSKSVQCLSKFPAQNWRGGEDGYFGFHIELIGGKVGKPRECSRFSTQNFFLSKSFGAHQISLLSNSDKVRFLQFCPEAIRLLKK